jgi:hypothetical protein
MSFTVCIRIINTTEFGNIRWAGCADRLRNNDKCLEHFVRNTRCEDTRCRWMIIFKVKSKIIPWLSSAPRREEVWENGGIAP